MPALWSRWAGPAEAGRTLSMCLVPGAYGKGCGLRWLVPAAESPGLGLQGLLPVIQRQGPVPRPPENATLHCWAIPLHWTLALSRPFCFHSALRSHIIDFVEWIIMFTQLCICSRLRTPQIWTLAVFNAICFQHTSLALPLPFLSCSDYGLSPCAENLQWAQQVLYNSQDGRADAF